MNDTVARIVSYVVSPILVPIATTGIFLWVVSADVGQSVAALSFIGFAFAVLPLMDILWMVSRGFAPSVELPERSQRVEPLGLAVVAGIVGIVIYQGSESSIELVSLLAATYVANILVVLCVNAFWKISVHAAAVGGMLGATAFILGPVFDLSPPGENLLLIVLTALVPLVMWARLRLRAHTGAQVVAGAILGVAGHWAGLYYGTVWLYG